MMHSLGARAGVGTVRNACRGVGAVSVQHTAVAAAKAAEGAGEGPLTTSSRRACYGHERPQVVLARGLATEVDRMQHHIRVTEDMKISDPVKRVLAIENSSRQQQKQLARQLAIEHWCRHSTDTGSPACQIATLTVRIDALRHHLATLHGKDKSTKRGYVNLLNRRQRMLTYLKRTDFDTYRKIHQELGLS